MQESFNLVNAGKLIQQKWKTLLLFTLVCGIAAVITVYLMPQYFRSSATIVSANPVLADKARLFNNNIQGLYSYFGSGDDLDRIQGMANMDTTYKKLVDEFSLIGYYKIKNDSLSLMRRSAVMQLREDIHFERTEQGQLKIIAWTKQKQLSANIVNRMVDIVTETASAIWQKNYSQALYKLDSTVTAMQLEYQQVMDDTHSLSTATKELSALRKDALLEQIRQYTKLSSEFRIASQVQPAVLYTLEKATPAAKAERPNKLNTVIAACLIGFAFSCLLVLVTNRKPA